MSAFTVLKETSKKFEDELQRMSIELLSAKIGETFEDNITNKLHNLSLLTSKLRFLRAKPLSLTPQISEQEHDLDTVQSEYGEAVTTRVLEQLVSLGAAQAAAVKTLVTTPDRVLDQDMLERKHKIITHLSEYRTQEATVMELDELLKEKEEQLARAREEWEGEVAALRGARAEARGITIDIHDPLYKKLSVMVDKMELMRWLVSRLGMSRSRGYDWLGDPHRRLSALKLARHSYNIDNFLQ